MTCFHSENCKWYTIQTPFLVENSEKYVFFYYKQSGNLGLMAVLMVFLSILYINDPIQIHPIKFECPQSFNSLLKNINWQKVHFRRMLSLVIKKFLASKISHSELSFFLKYNNEIYHQLLAFFWAQKFQMVWNSNNIFGKKQWKAWLFFTTTSLNVCLWWQLE